MKVLMLNPSFSAGGYMHNLCNGLADAGVSVDLFTGPHFWLSSRNWARVAYRPRIRFYRWTQAGSYRPGPLRPLWRLLRLAGHFWSMARLVIDAGRYDVVHIHFLPLPAIDRFWMGLIARRTAVVYTVHNLLPHDARSTPALQRLFGRIYRQAHQLIGHTHATVQGIVEGFGIPAERITRVEMGNANHLRDLRNAVAPESLGLRPGDPPLVLMLGEIRQNKGLDVLLRAAAELRDRGVEFRVIVAGVSVTDIRPYLQLAEELKLGSLVEFRLGYIQEEAVPTYFRSASVVALPYRQIDQSLVAISATSMGRPLVATRIAGLAEVVSEGRCGLLVEVDDARGLADAIAALLADPGLRDRLGANATAYADGPLGWERLAGQTIGAYREAIKRAGSHLDTISGG